MKRTTLLKHLRKNGCVFVREGENHSWWANRKQNRRSSVPRHSEIVDQQADIWGADWNPTSQQITYESLINIRPRQNNRSMEILDPKIGERVARITYRLLGEK